MNNVQELVNWYQHQPALYWRIFNGTSTTTNRNSSYGYCPESLDDKEEGAIALEYRLKEVRDTNRYTLKTFSSNKCTGTPVAEMRFKLSSQEINNHSRNAIGSLGGNPLGNMHFVEKYYNALLENQQQLFDFKTQRLEEDIAAIRESQMSMKDKVFEMVLNPETLPTLLNTCVQMISSIRGVPISVTGVDQNQHLNFQAQTNMAQNNTTNNHQQNHYTEDDVDRLLIVCDTLKSKLPNQDIILLLEKLAAKDANTLTLLANMG